MVASKPATGVELDYRDLLSEANECYFHREYTVALGKYLQLREMILQQSHPELPKVPGLTYGSLHGADIIDPSRLVELSRRILLKVPPGDPVIIPATSDCLFRPDEVAANPVFDEFRELGVDGRIADAARFGAARQAARKLAFDGDAEGAGRSASRLAGEAIDAGDHRLAAELLAEAAAMIATYQAEDRTAAIKFAASSFSRAAKLYGLLGDTRAVAAMQTNLQNLRKEAADSPVDSQDGFAGLPELRSSQIYLAPDGGVFKSAAGLVTTVAGRPEPNRTVGILTAGTTAVASLQADKYQDRIGQLYADRISATTLAGIEWQEAIATTFVAYIPHLFFYVLPLAIADTYAALGQYRSAFDGYTGVLSYPSLNENLEAANLWQRMASVQLRWGDDLFRRGDTAGALTHYETIAVLPGTVPAASPLYSPAAFAVSKAAAAQVLAQLTGQPAGSVNPRLAQLVTAAFTQLTKIDAGLNFLGLSDDFYPVGRFRSLQAAANFFADAAVTAERTFIQFRTQAEQQKFERLQLESAVQLNEAALAMENARLADAALDSKAAAQTFALTQQRQAAAQANLADWETLGVELTSMDAALVWAANAANDQKITYTGVQYDGARHDYSGDVEDFFDQVGEKREWVNYEIQHNRIERQVLEAAHEVAIAQTRAQQAEVRRQVQQLNLQLADVRLQGAQQVLAYTEQRMFGEDLWFRLAADLEDLARSNLDMAIEAAFLMQRAYDLEFDRDLRRVRLDYGLSGAAGGGAQGLLGGDFLKRDIASFTEDYITHARKQNPIRAVLSLREEFPQAFNAFQSTGRLDFHTDLELFDRRWPGTYRRKVKRIELFVQGLIPSDGVRGTLAHSGISTEWRFVSGAWTKHTRVLPADTMLLSSYQYRRDLAVLQPPEDLLALFENLGPQGNWSLTLPGSANDLDFSSISDIGLVYYFDADLDLSLAAHTRALYGDQGARSFVLSSRFQYPDEWYRLDAERSVDFEVLTERLPRFVTQPALSAFAVRLVPTAGQPAPVGLSLTVTRASDASSITVVTEAGGAVIGDGTTMAPFTAWQGASPADTFTVAFTDGAPPAGLADVQLAISYGFTYRADTP
ncbi:hypothetical protein MQE23_00425 [Streptomyces sp. HP-A2021]|uniref:Tc toxin subunit A-related protein n=1 Tax=Streptomyces sp. HP-A2021 TaxID=2927875 RepID=UPI001FB014A8|nr:hypothetical protein [Streptomyces sp. HP-A2021]UOB07645.1 hypothetical protein MQE23_00425 [Streptomyces sp. HP-A2021]